jgi:hypothetical protein
LPRLKIFQYPFFQHAHLLLRVIQPSTAKSQQLRAALIRAQRIAASKPKAFCDFATIVIPQLAKEQHSTEAPVSGLIFVCHTASHQLQPQH